MTIRGREGLTVAIVALATVVLVTAATLMVTPQYTTSTRVAFVPGAVDSAQDRSEASALLRKQLDYYAEAAASPAFLAGVVRVLELDLTSQQLVGLLRVKKRPDLIALDITVTDVNPFRAADIGNAVAQQLSASASELSASRGGPPRVESMILAPALVPMKPSSPKVGPNLALGWVGGLLLGAALVILRRRLSPPSLDQSKVRAARPDAPSDR